jgi:hypothetical protein
MLKCYAVLVSRELYLCVSPGYKLAHARSGGGTARGPGGSNGIDLLGSPQGRDDMLKSTTFIGACLAVLVAGCATHAPTGKLAAANNPDCVKSTGTRIEDTHRPCVGVPGSSYTQEDLQHTGEIDTGAALKKMDPRFH